MTDSETLVIADAPPKRCHSCQATNPDRAKFCWMCGAPLAGEVPPPRDEVVQASLIKRVDEEQRDDPLALKLAPLAAVPLVVIVIYGMFQYDPVVGWIFGPALAVAALAAVAHQLLVRGLVKPKSVSGKAGVATSSVLVGLLAGFGAFAATVLVIIVLLVMAVISVIAAIAKICGIEFSG